MHSFVEFVDGSVLAQMGVPSMELPILFALTYPDRVPDSGLPPFDPVALGGLTFEAVRRDDFPMLDLGISTTDGVPNAGLIQFKRSIGARSEVRLQLAGPLRSLSAP